ncbi:cupin domain-containing protein [Alkalibacillus almallahensis]|uniref:cupin domain-containing protein n=1 Tax=Alkalibacillus almallahensis TaxID=1379154 RepID=UPI001421C2BF|nr:cupin domain-containing protein [Alkalibacillus almallahensis]NIK12636.1 mannose-6-phosphate isomerase-like protein (cupin superfamily) [Alkalibacillus almallahensis]
MYFDPNYYDFRFNQQDWGGPNQPGWSGPNQPGWGPPGWNGQPGGGWQPPQDRVDYGPNPYVVNIERATMMNPYYRRALWTGEYLQLTLMSIAPGDDIGLERHQNHDQFIRIEGGRGLVQMGDRRDRPNFEREVRDNDAIFIPAGKWHNLTNIGRSPLKLYSIYAPPEHPRGTVHETKQDASHNQY